MAKAQGFSDAVAARVEAPQRSSTRKVYQAKWSIFTKWCTETSKTLKSIVDFLLHLFEVRGLQPSTIEL